MTPTVLLSLLLATQLASATGHAVRFTLDPDPNRKRIAGAGAVLYGILTILLALAYLVPGSRALAWTGHAAVWVSVIGPMIGLTSVLATGSRPDAPQLTMGAVQLLGIALAIALLSHP